jgi:lysophospholipase
MKLLTTLKFLPVFIACLGVSSQPHASPDESSILEGRAARLKRDSLTTTSPWLCRRALPNAPNGYTPEGEACPATKPFVRNGTTLSANETAWLQLRRNVTVDAMKDFLGRLDLGSFNVSSYVQQNAANASALPNIGIAASGGGYRALMNGGGALQAFDSRTPNNSGQLGGVLQSATYLAGLSGGSWLVGSLYLNNFTDVTSLRDSGTVWLFQDSIFVGPTQSTDFSIRTSEYFLELQDAVSGKADAGYNTSITDYW